MPFPRKFKALLEGSPAVTPDYLWLVYAVCGCERESCGWHGWVIETACCVTGERHATGSGGRLVESDDYLRCPKCGRDLYRTDSVRFDRSPDQTQPGGTPGIDYEVVGPTYLDDDDPAWEAENNARR
jgi:hypothetical protein